MQSNLQENCNIEDNKTQNITQDTSKSSQWKMIGLSFLISCLVLAFFEFAEHNLFGSFGALSMHFLSILFAAALTTRIIHYVFDRVKKHNERVISEKLNFYQTLLDTIPTPIFFKDTSGKYCDCNKAFGEFLGIERQDIIGCTAQDFQPLEQAQIFKQKDDELYSGTGIQFYETVVKHKTGTAHDAVFHKAIYKTINGEVRGIVGTIFDTTTPKKTEYELRKSEAQFRSAFEYSTVGMAITTPDGNYIKVNKVLCEMLGYTEDEFYQKNFRDLTYIEECEDVLPFLKELLEGKTQYFQSEKRYIHKSGREVWTQFSISAVRDSEGNILQHLVQLQDITHRKESEKALRESEAKYRLLYEKMSLGSMYYQLIQDETGAPADILFLDVNAAAEKLIGLNREIFIGKRGSEMFPDIKSSQFNWIGAAGAIALSGQEIKVEQYFEPFDRWYSIFAYSPQMGYFVSLFDDITERKQIEKEILQNKHFIDSIANTVPEAIYILDLDKMSVEYMNKAIEKVLGYTPEEMIAFGNRLLSELLHPEDWGKYNGIRLLDEGVSSNGIQEVEWRIKHKDGNYRWIGSRRTIFKRNEQGRPTQILGCLNDITERKKMMDEVFKIEKLESIGILAGGIAHDFNNILAVILGNIQLANIKVGMGDKERALEILTTVQKAIMKAKDLTLQLLAFSKGGVPIKKTASIKEVLNDSVSLMLRGSNVCADFSHQDDLWPVEVDVAQISQVVSNMVINAMQAMPDGGKIQILTENIVIDKHSSIPVKPGNYVKITISDNGAGINNNHIKQIFDPYFTTKQKGSGLGLAICYSIINNHAGHITVQSEVGNGTMFEIYLPAYPGTFVAIESDVEEIKMGIGKVLVMDDEEMIRELLSDMLTELGYDVSVSKEGNETITRYLEALESGGKFDVVIMDLTIPGGLGGKETIRKLLEIAPDVKAIVSSGYSDDDVMANYKEYGFCDMMLKPYRIEDISNILAKVIGK